MRLFDLVEEQDREGRAADLREEAGFAGVGLSPDEALDGIGVGILPHVEAQQPRPRAEEILGEALREVGLADPGGPGERNVPMGLSAPARPALKAATVRATEATASGRATTRLVKCCSTSARRRRWPVCTPRPEAGAEAVGLQQVAPSDDVSVRGAVAAQPRSRLADEAEGAPRSAWPAWLRRLRRTASLGAEARGARRGRWSATATRSRSASASSASGTSRGTRAARSSGCRKRRACRPWAVGDHEGQLAGAGAEQERRHRAVRVLNARAGPAREVQVRDEEGGLLLAGVLDQGGDLRLELTDVDGLDLDRRNRDLDDVEDGRRRRGRPESAGGSGLPSINARMTPTRSCSIAVDSAVSSSCRANRTRLRRPVPGRPTSRTLSPWRRRPTSRRVNAGRGARSSRPRRFSRSA